MKNKKKLKPFLALLLMLSLYMQMFTPVAAEESNEIIYIKNTADFLKFAENCIQDTWSQGKYFELMADIELGEKEFEPIPTFGGTFDGNGYSINGLIISESYSPTGLFAYVQPTAIIKNIKVSGTVKPSGDANEVGGIAGVNEGQIVNCSFYGYVNGKDSVGGIAGVNEESGEIRSCQSSSSITGKNYSGGIVGTNHGTINNCKNSGDVNTHIADAITNLSELKIDSFEDINSTTDTAVHLDSGGIAGISDGKIYYCTNSGSIGYPHIGYNIGGIVGRLHQGYLQNCTNTGTVYGRKDVGGIAGQMEPFLEIQYLDGRLNELERETEIFFDLIDTTYDNISSYGSKANGLIKNISSCMKKANSAGTNMTTASRQLWNVYNQEIGEINEELKDFSNDLDGSGIEIVDYREAIQNLINNTGDNVENITDASKTHGKTIFNNAEILNNQLEAANNSLADLFDVLQSGTDSTNKDVDAISKQAKKLRKLVNEIRSDLFRKEDMAVNDLSEEDIHYDASSFQKGKITLCINRGNVAADINVAGITGQIGTEYDIDPETDISIIGSENFEIEHTVKAVIRESKNYGEINAKKDYAGGVVGKTELGAIISCENYGDITSSSGNYIGGIAGLSAGSIRESFVKATLSGNDFVGGIIGTGNEDTIVAGCYSLVDITEGNQYIGAIAGTNKGTFLENYFVSNKLAAINRVNSTAKAEPILYSDLMELINLPSEFKKLTLKFIADNTTLKTITFDYGDSFDDSVYPEIPSKDGYYAKWDITDLKQLKYDAVVTAVYEEYVTALRSEEYRKDERPVFFVEGQFTDNDKISVTKHSEVTSVSDIVANSEKWYTFMDTNKIVEQWQIDIPENAAKSHVVRYLSPDGNTENMKLYLLLEEGWKEVETEEIGSYLCFPVTENKVELAVISNSSNQWILCIAVLLIIVAIILMCLLIRRKRVGVILGILGTCGVIGIMITWLITQNSKILNAYDILCELNQSENLCMTLEVEAQVGNDELSMNADIHRKKIEKQVITRIKQEGVVLYYSDGVVVLENGKAFKTSDLFPDYSKLINHTVELYQVVDVAVTDTATGKQYSVTTKQEGATVLTELLLPSYVGEFSDTQVVTISLFTEGDALSYIDFSVIGNLNDDSNTKVTVAAKLKFKDESETEFSSEIVNMIINHQFKVEEVLTEDIFRLAVAWSEMNNQDTISAKLKLEADCGPITVNDEMLLIQKKEKDATIGYIRKNASTLYFTENKVCNGNGSIVTDGKESMLQPAKLPEIIYQLCLNGNFNCTKVAGDYLYTLVLDESGMKAIAQIIAPEANISEVAFTSGSIQITVRDEKIYQIQMNCDGNIQIAFIETPVSFSAELIYDDTNLPAGFSIPENVIKTLTK